MSRILFAAKTDLDGITHITAVGSYLQAVISRSRGGLPANENGDPSNDNRC